MFQILQHYIEGCLGQEEPYQTYIDHWRQSERLDDPTVDFMAKDLLHYAYIGKIEWNLPERTAVITLSSYDSVEDYRLIYDGVDFSKSLLSLDRQM